MSLAGGVLIVFLFQGVTVMSQGITPSVLPDHNLDFPLLPQDFKEMAQKLMFKCSQKGYSAPIPMNFLNSSFMRMEDRMARNPISLFPSLLSSLPSLFSMARSSLKPDTTERFEQEQAMNITEKMWNCTNLPQMIELMRNTTEKTYCFIRAFVAPLSWATILQNATQLDPMQLNKLLWAAKPFIETMPPSPLTLPPSIQSSHLADLMKFFSDIFTSLSEEQRDQIRRWMKDRVIENESNCRQNQTVFNAFTTQPVRPSVSAKPEPVTVQKGQMKELMTDMSRVSMTEVTTGNDSMRGEKPPKREQRAADNGKGIGQVEAKVTDILKVNPTKAASPADEHKSPAINKEVPQPGPGNDSIGMGGEPKEGNGKGLDAGNSAGKNESKGLGGEKNQTGSNGQSSDGKEIKSEEKGKYMQVEKSGGNAESGGNSSRRILQATIKVDSCSGHLTIDTASAIPCNKENDTSTEDKVPSNQGQKESDAKKKEDSGNASKESKGNGSSNGEKGKKNEEQGKDNKTDYNSSFPGCPPRMPWLKADALRMMGRFFSRLPEVEVKIISAEELCKFFLSPEFPSSFVNVGHMKPVIGQMLLQRLKRECSNDTQTFFSHVDRLGSLACFFDDVPSLNATLSKKLLSQLGDCENSGIDEMKRELVRKVMMQVATPSLDLLKSLGFGASILPPSKLSDFSAETLMTILASLSQTKWKPAQARILASKILEKAENISVEKLLSLGSIIRGVDSDLLKKVKAEWIVGNEGLKILSEKMSPLQKKALLLGISVNFSASDLVKEVPDSLLSSFSLSTLEKAAINSVAQLEGRTWTRIQSVYLVKKIVGSEIKLDQLRKLGQAVQGITCNMVDSFNESNALETAQILAQSPDFLSRTQVHCIAQKLFMSLEKQRPGYFINITDSELQAIPSLMLIHLPIRIIQILPAAVCPRFLEKMSQANLSSLPNNAPSRQELRDRALRCLGKNALDLSAAEILSLGPLVCELDPAWISTLNSAALNSTLQAMVSCAHIPRPYRGPLFMLLTRVYGNPSDWSEETMKSMGPLLLLNETAMEMLSFKTWLKSALKSLLDNMPTQPAAPAPEEFRYWPDLSVLRRKLFQLQTRVSQQRRKRAVLFLFEPTTIVIENLGEENVYWSPSQLANMTTQTFREAVSALGEIRNYTVEQLLVLRKKAMEAWGNVSMLNESQILEMGCVSQSFSPEQLQNLNITSLDTLEILSVCHWNISQKAAICQGFMDRNGLQVNKLRALEMAGLGHFICGLQPNQIDQLNTGEFKEAVGDLGRAQCPLNILECLKRKAVAAFGDPQTWSEAEVSIMGNIIAGLNGTELARLNCSVMSFIRQSAIFLIPPEQLVLLSVSQLRALGPDNAAVITESQRAVLRPEQRAAIEAAMGVLTARTETSTSSPSVLPQKGGAPKPAVLGILILLQLLVLLLLGFIH